jgi:hypothetical protein
MVIPNAAEPLAIDLEQVGPADRLVVPESADQNRKWPRLVAMLTVALLPPRQAAWQVAHQRGDTGVRVPAVDKLGIARLEGTQVHEGPACAADRPG